MSPNKPSTGGDSNFENADLNFQNNKPVARKA
jgi:hypothetical protein